MTVKTVILSQSGNSNQKSSLIIYCLKRTRATQASPTGRGPIVQTTFQLGQVRVTLEIARKYFCMQLVGSAARCSETALWDIISTGRKEL